jgi:hypothetical protein
VVAQQRFKSSEQTQEFLSFPLTHLSIVIFVHIGTDLRQSPIAR